MSADEEVGGRRARRSTFGDGAPASDDAFAVLLAGEQTDAAPGGKVKKKVGKAAKAPKPVAKAKRPRPARRPANALDVGGVPRVDLLPTELRNARAWRVARGRALIIVLLAAILVLAGVGTALWHAATTDLARDAAAARTVELTDRQGRFGDVSALLSRITRSEEALATASADEVDWPRLLDDLGRALPAGSRVTTVAVDSTTPLTEIAQPADPLRGARIGTLTFTAFTPTIPDTAAWVRALNEVEGFENATPRAAVAEAPDALGTGVLGYTIEIAVDLTDRRLVTPPEAEAPAEEEDAS
ncbi:hypothetical protein B5M43_001550 [Microbacterium sp. MEC084]|uniref:hypothetical protein n=1 Tax=unclassified Microbacterium TaxID=2609290 RepID=UPI0006F5DA25|nr:MULTISPECIES: hypothetical protein [unclassified Microbacterium]KQZ04922.1 hypothetical protein ASD19_02570 [Microbacterium sp. Root53]MCD1267538.1 hypothetical protein [Microbacterium sp. MEC084]